MCRHEERSCPRCGEGFECKPGSITQCQCFGIFFSEAEKNEIEQQYSDCLCRACLIEMKDEIAVKAINFVKK